MNKYMKNFKVTHFSHQFPVIAETDETGGYVVECPIFEGCYSQGDTLDEALNNIKEVLAMCLEEQKDNVSALAQKRFGIHLVTV